MPEMPGPGVKPRGPLHWRRVLALEGKHQASRIQNGQGRDPIAFNVAGVYDLPTELGSWRLPSASRAGWSQGRACWQQASGCFGGRRRARSCSQPHQAPSASGSWLLSSPRSSRPLPRALVAAPGPRLPAFVEGDSTAATLSRFAPAWYRAALAAGLAPWIIWVTTD